MGQGTNCRQPSIYIGGHEIKAVDNFKYLGSIISSNLSLASELNNRTAKAAVVVPKIQKRVWPTCSLTINTKMKVYTECVLSTLLYSSEARPTYVA